MFRRILAAALACAVFGTVSAAAYAESGEISSESQQEIEYIHSEIVEKKVNTSVYEEVIANQIVFYSNISNGAVIENPVSLDFPETVTVAMEKDGKKSEYTIGDPIEEPGKYSLTIMVEGKNLLGGNENEVYYGMFRFWITEPSEESEPDESEDSEDSESEFSSEESGEESTSDSSDASSDSSDASDDSSDSSSGGKDENPSNPDNEDEVMGTLLPKTDKVTNISQYVTNKRIRVVTDKGAEFFCNIPAGMATSNGVLLELSPKDTAEYKLMKDGEVLSDFEFGRALTQRGEYTLFVNDGDKSNPAKFSFTIYGEGAHGITKYTVPDGCKIEKAMFGKNEIRVNGNTVDMGAEGAYSFEISCGDLKYSESFRLDNTPPEFRVNGIDDERKANGGTVIIELLSDDIDTYTIVVNEQPVKKSLELTAAGKYVVTVYDKAGNSTSQEFEIIYQMDAMAIVAVVLGGALIIAGIVFFFITRKKFSIR